MSKRFSTQFKIKSEVFSRDRFKCQKCGFMGNSEELEAHHIRMRVDGGDDLVDNLVTLCFICHYFAPDNDKDFEIYLKEKLNGTILNTFRKSQKSISKRTKKGMNSKFQGGNLVTKAPLGYQVIDKQLVPKEDSYIVQEIYQTFLNQDISLTQLAKKYSLSVNGLKKVLVNQTYLGKVKFAGQVVQGKHNSLISQELFDKAQNKLKEKGWIK